MIELFRECKSQRANCQSSYSLWVFLHRSLFVCPLNAQQSHSKWIICLSKRIVLGQIMCCTGNSFAPAWNLSWISFCCGHSCSLHPLLLSQVQRISLHLTEIQVWTDTNMSVLLLTNGSVTLPTHIQLLMRSWKVSQQVWCHQWCAFTGLYGGTSIYQGMPHSHLFCAGVAVILVLARW